MIANEDKLELIQQKWGEEVPDYLWFLLGEKSFLSVDEVTELSQLFFSGEGEAGDIEVHRSSREQIDGQAVLRVRRSKLLVPHLSLGGVTYHLYQVGYFDGTDSRAICFL
jgi:hypothetical protein